jgi:hypothetical protein
MPDTTEHPPIAGRSETATTVARTAPSAPNAPPPDDTDFFGIVHHQSMALLECQEQALRYAVDRTQDWIDCGAVWMKGCSQLPREAVDASRDSIRMAIEDSAKLFRLWTEIGFQVAAPFAGPKTQAN